MSSTKSNNNKDLIEITSNLVDLVDSFTKGDISAFRKLLSFPATMREMYFSKKFLLYLEGIESKRNDAAKKLANLLREPDDTYSENAYRLFHLIDAFETFKAVEFLINLTDSWQNGDIDRKMFFRVAHVLANTFYEDLVMIKEVPVNEEISGKEWIDELSKNGLLTSSGIDANRSIYNQSYCLSPLGYLTDKYAVSKYDGQRQQELDKFLSDCDEVSNCEVSPLTMSKNDMEQLLEETGL